MIKRSITFKDFDDNEVTEEHYFHLSKSELIEMELAGGASGFAEHLQAVVQSNDVGKILGTFRDIIRAAYGQRDPANPQRFFKSEKLRDEFMSSLAFDALFTEMMQNEAACSEFVKGIVPNDLVNYMDVNVSQQPGTPAVVATGTSMPSKAELDILTGLKEPRDRTNELVPWAFREPSDQELTSMTKQQLLDVTRRQMAGWKPTQP